MNGMNLGLVVARSSGLLELYDVFGDLLYRHPLGFAAKHLASTSSYDDIKIIAASGSKAVLVSFEMSRQVTNATEIRETGQQSTHVSMSVTDEVDLQVPEPLCAMHHYVKLGSKYWTLADCKGSLQLYSFNGTLIRSVELENPVYKFERFGQQLSFMSESSVGHMNVDQFKSFQFCQMGARVVDMAIDNSQSITYLHALLETGYLYTVDSANDCKRISKYFSLKINSLSKLVSLRGAALVWTGSELLYFDIEGKEAQSLEVKGGKGILASQRTQSGSTYIAIDTENGVRLYEYVVPFKNPAGFDFSSLRFVVLIVIVGLIVLWQVMKKKQPKLKDE